MNQYSPFADVTDMAKHSFYTVEEIERRANSEFEYNQQMFAGMIINAIQHKAYQDSPERVRGELIVSESIDISKTIWSASKQEKGVRPYGGLTKLLK